MTGKPEVISSHVRLCDQERQVWTVGDRPTEVKVRSLVAWIAGRREIEFPKPIDKAIFRMVSKSSGRNESERRCGLESEKPQGLSLQPKGESSMDRRRLTDAAAFTLPRGKGKHDGRGALRELWCPPRPGEE